MKRTAMQFGKIMLIVLGFGGLALRTAVDSKPPRRSRRRCTSFRTEHALPVQGTVGSQV